MKRVLLSIVVTVLFIGRSSGGATRTCTNSAPGPTGTAYGGGLYTGFCTDPNAENFGGSFYFVITPAGCDITASNNPTCNGADTRTLKYDSTSPVGMQKVSGFTDRHRGDLNSSGLAALGSTYKAASYCENLVYGGYSDWYLPSSGELLAVFKKNRDAGGDPLAIAGLKYWSSREAPASPITDAVSVSNTVEYSTSKYEDHLIRCMRRVTTGLY